MNDDRPLLEIRHLLVYGIRPILRGLDFEILRGERVGLIGPSGSGKSLTALSCLGLLPRGLHFGASEIRVDGVDLLALPERERAAFRGRRISLAFQEAGSALNPVWSIGFQLRELERLYFPGEKAGLRSEEMLHAVGLGEGKISRAYPHELSGGQRQRALLAMALIGEPDLLLADEITSSLDLLSRKAVLGVLDRLCRERELALLMISHDLESMLSRVDRVILIEEGMLIEDAPTEVFIREPLHPLSRRLLQASLSGGVPPESRRDPFPEGCPHAHRCPRFEDRCAAELPPLVEVERGRRCRCFFPETES